MLTARLTDRLGSGSGDEPQTTEDFPFRVTVPCAATGSTSTGSTCALTTTADSLMPGAVPEGKRSIWALDRVQRQRRRTGLGRRHARRQHAVRHAGRLRALASGADGRHHRRLRLHGRAVPRRAAQRRTCACSSTYASGAASAGRSTRGRTRAACKPRWPRPASNTATTGSWPRRPSCGISSTGRTTGSASASAHDRSSRRPTASATSRRSSTGWTWPRSSGSCPTEGASALFCVERDPEACHRSLIAARLADEYGLPVVHLRPD